MNKSTPRGQPSIIVHGERMCESGNWETWGEGETETHGKKGNLRDGERK